MRTVSYSMVCWVKNSADDILKWFLTFSQKTGFDISCKLSPMGTIYMKCQIVFFEKKKKKKKKIINVSSAALIERVVKLNARPVQNKNSHQM